MFSIAVTGAAGRMGTTNIRVIESDADCKVVAALDSPQNPNTGKDAGLTAGISALNVPVSKNIKEWSADIDGIIDFSAPVALQAHLDFAVQNTCALAIGTTGLTDTHFEAIRAAAKSIPIVWAPNFSVGINLSAKLVKLAAQVLGNDFDVEIIEAHHNLKKDAPSGTALKFLKIVQETFQTNDVVYGREGIVGARPKTQIGVHAVRGGDIVGDHTILFAGQGERVEITHKASSRETFARGALRALKTIIGKKPRLYEIEELFGLL